MLDNWGVPLLDDKTTHFSRVHVIIRQIKTLCTPFCTHYGKFAYDVFTEAQERYKTIASGKIQIST